MASTIPMKGDSAYSGNSASLGVVGIGQFGDRVAGDLVNTNPGARLVASSDIQNAFAVSRSAVVVALWRPEPLLCEKADELAHRHGVPWLPVTMEHPVIRIGPLVWPRRGPCFRCYRARREQHDVQPAATAALLQAYRDDSSAGPGGYLPHQANMAAALARQMLGYLADGDGQGKVAAGQVISLRLLGGGMSASRVIACHDCRRCGGALGAVGNLPEVLLGNRECVTEPSQDRACSSGQRVAP